MRMHGRRLVTVMLLAAWVLLDPIAIAFSGCDGMGARCEVLCGLTCSAGPALTSTAATIPSGAMGERWRLKAFFIYDFFMSMILYPLFGN